MLITQPVFAKIVFLINRQANEGLIIKCLLSAPYNLSICQARDALNLSKRDLNMNKSIKIIGFNHQLLGFGDYKRIECVRRTFFDVGYDAAICIVNAVNTNGHYIIEDVSNEKIETIKKENNIFFEVIEEEKDHSYCKCMTDVEFLNIRIAFLEQRIKQLVKEKAEAVSKHSQFVEKMQTLFDTLK